MSLPVALDSQGAVFCTVAIEHSLSPHSPCQKKPQLQAKSVARHNMQEHMPRSLNRTQSIRQHHSRIAVVLRGCSNSSWVTVPQHASRRSLAKSSCWSSGRNPLPNRAHKTGGKLPTPLSTTTTTAHKPASESHTSLSIRRFSSVFNTKNPDQRPKNGM